MEKVTRALEVTSAIVILITGIYVQFAFSEILGPVTRLTVGLLATVYVVVRLVPWAKSKLKDIETVSG